MNQSPHFVEGSHVLDAWRKGCLRIIACNDREQFNMITTIKNPTYLTKSWLQKYNPKKICCKKQSLSDVVNTIFPGKYLNQNLSASKIYSRYKMAHDRSKMINKKSSHWGTYFLRMIEFGDGKKNQLQKIIDALNSWNKNRKAAIVIHISSPDVDSSAKIMGHPCLQYIQLLCPDPSAISMLAVYRNHDYFGKTLGNFIGLGHLLSFVCRETGRSPAGLICHSAHAYSAGSKKNLKKLVNI